MPQDSLWAASARPTSFTFTYRTPDSRLDDRGLLAVHPGWSKRPTGRDGSTQFEVETYTSWHLHEVFRASFEQFLGGQAANVGRVARAAYRDVHQGFELGVRG